MRPFISQTINITAPHHRKYKVIVKKKTKKTVQLFSPGAHSKQCDEPMLI